jgi:hypothetical protein
MKESKGIILIDELVDLMHNERVAKSGGRKLFEHLTNLIVIYMVNYSKVRGAVACNSNLLLKEFLKSVALHSRWHI